MRALRVVGLGTDGRTVILETVTQRPGERRERFTLPVDDNLQAAVRGDLSRLDQIEIELESQMRPREIQARIRAGASVEQVATAAGVPTQRIERFAYPVLMERSRIAELAQQAHPVRDDGPDVRTLTEVVSGTFALRGHDYDTAAWDSWRGEDGKWVVQLRWWAGRSENRAHWTFHPGAHGGTVTTLDDNAVALIDPSAGQPLRTVRPVTELAQQALAEPARRPVADEPPAVEEPTPAPARAETEQPTSQPTEQPERPAAETEQAATGTDPSPRRTRRGRPIVPSWEDVLLGTRSNRD
jgi:DUF3071 family protein